MAGALNMTARMPNVLKIWRHRPTRHDLRFIIQLQHRFIIADHGLPGVEISGARTIGYPAITKARPKAIFGAARQ